MALTYPIYTVILSYQATSHNPTIFHHLDIDHVGTQRSSASCAMLTRTNNAETAVYGCWLLSSIFIFFLVAKGFCPFLHCRLSAHAFGFNLPNIHLVFFFRNLYIRLIITIYCASISHRRKGSFFRNYSNIHLVGKLLGSTLLWCSACLFDFTQFVILENLSLLDLALSEVKRL